jgi:membrane protease YdiL (CAAX protease family)
MTTIFIMVTSFFVIFLLGYVLAVPLFDLSFQELSGILSGKGQALHPHLIKYFQILQTVGLFVVPPFIAARFLSREPAGYLGFRHQPNGWSLLTVVVLIFASLPLINFLSQVNQHIDLPDQFGSLEQWLMNREETARRMTDQFLRAQNLGALAVNLLMVAVLPALGEELLFRGVVQRIFSEWTRSVHWGVVIAAFLFSAMHVQFYGLIPRMFLGILFGYLLVWSGSMWLPVLAHFVNNASAVVYYYFVQDEMPFSATGYELFGEHLTGVIFSAIMVVLCCYVVYTNGRSTLRPKNRY